MFKIFTVYDKVAEFHMQPFFARTNGEAIRSFSQAVNEDPQKSQIAAHPHQYELFEIGSFDEQLGLIAASVFKGDAKTPVDLVRNSLGLGSDFKLQHKD